MDVKFHTKEKHILIGDYLSICANVHKGKEYPFFFVDLYAGDGMCRYKIGDKLVDSWEGAPVLASRILTESGIKYKCLFNEIDPSSFESLKQTLEGYEYIEFYNGDANEVYKEILTEIPKERHSLILIDPWKHSDLNWKTIERIAEHKTPWRYKDKKRKVTIEFTRRPEIIFNLMTYTMQTSYKQNPELIDRYLGTDVWREKIVEFEKEGRPISEAFLETAVEQFRKIYNEEPFPIQVNRIGTEQLLYYIIFVSNHPLANEIFSDYYDKYIEKHRKELEKEHIKIIAKASGLSSLDRWMM